MAIDLVELVHGLVTCKRIDMFVDVINYWENVVRSYVVYNTYSIPNVFLIIR